MNPWLDDDVIARERAKALAESKGNPFVVSVSGGKDSTATCLWLQVLGIPYRAVHMATGWEHADTDSYLRDYLPGVVGPIDYCGFDKLVDPEKVAIAEQLEAKYLGGKPSALIRVTLKKGMFSSRVRRFCTQELKVRPFQRWAKENMDGMDFVNVVGVRAQESSSRSKLPPWDMDDDGYLVWRPLLDWTEEQVIDIHLWRDIRPNPLYIRGASRVGCLPCIFSRKAEIRQTFEMDPTRLELIAELEEIVTDRAQARAAMLLEQGEDIGDTFHHPDGSPKFRAYFMNPYYKRDFRNHRKAGEDEAGRLGLEGDEATAFAHKWAKDRTSAQLPIKEVFAWSKTRRNGDDEPFARLPHEAGCTRWGFCDVSWRADHPPQADLFTKENA